MSIDDLKTRYERLFGYEPTPRGVIHEIEWKLGLALPADFKHNPDTWPSYAEFFRFLLDSEEQERT